MGVATEDIRVAHAQNAKQTSSVFGFVSCYYTHYASKMLWNMPFPDEKKF